MADQELREVTLPTGAVLKINDAPFKDAHALYQAVLKMLVFAEVPEGKEKRDVIKDYLPLTLASPEVHQAVMKCFERATYNEKKITDATFEPIEARKDFVQACIEVQIQNLDPFLAGVLLKSSAKPAKGDTSTQK